MPLRNFLLGGAEMKKRILIGLAVMGLIAAVNLSAPAASDARISISIAIPFPGVVIAEPPALVMVPGTYAYLAPEADIVFYRGYWYRPYGGYWYIAADWQGPWQYVAVQQVPVVVVNVPVYYRSTYVRSEPIPAPVVLRNWRAWEDERRWDRHDRGRSDDNDYDRGSSGRGRGHGNSRHWDD